jgi:hypothetical protein
MGKLEFGLDELMSGRGVCLATLSQALMLCCHQTPFAREWPFYRSRPIDIKKSRSACSTGREPTAAQP